MNLFVWDFHGTLEKNNELATKEITNLVLKQAGHKVKLTTQDNLRLYGASWHSYYAHLLPNHPSELHHQLQTASFLYPLGPEIVRKHIRPTPHAHTVLTKIAQKGHTQIVISRTAPNSLIFFLEAVNMSHFFPEGHALAIDGHVPNPTRSKQTILNAFLENKHFDRIITIGDSPADMELIRDESRDRSYLFCHPNKTHRECSAHYRINDLREVLREL